MAMEISRGAAENSTENDPQNNFEQHLVINLTKRLKS